LEATWRRTEGAEDDEDSGSFDRNDILVGIVVLGSLAFAAGTAPALPVLLRAGSSSGTALVVASL